MAKRTQAVKVNPRAKGLVKATFRLTPELLEKLKAAARRRAEERGAMMGDASELVREALEAAFMKRRP